MDKTYLQELADSFRWFENDYINAMKDLRENIENTLRTIIEEQKGVDIEIPSTSWTVFNEDGESYNANIIEVHIDYGNNELSYIDWDNNVYPFNDQDIAMHQEIMDVVLRTYGCE